MPIRILAISLIKNLCLKLQLERSSMILDPIQEKTKCAKNCANSGKRNTATEIAQFCGELDFHQSSERPACVVRLHTVVIDKHLTISVIAEDGTTKFADVVRGF